jgi:hypothetical protein
MTRGESNALKARATIRQRLLARLPATPLSLPRAYRSHLRTLHQEGLITYDKATGKWWRYVPESDGATIDTRAPQPHDGTAASDARDAKQLRKVGSPTCRHGVNRCSCEEYRDNVAASTRPPVVNEVAREDPSPLRTIDVMLILRVTTRAANLGKVASLVAASFDTCGGTEFLDGELSASLAAVTLNDWSIVK